MARRSQLSEVRGTHPGPGAAHRASDTVIPWGSDQGPGAARSEAATRGSRLTARLGHLNPGSTTRVKQPGPGSQRLWGFFPSVRGSCYLHNAAQHRHGTAWLPAAPKRELSAHICTPGSERRHVKRKAKANAWSIKVKARAEHCNKSEVGPRVCTKLFPDEKGRGHNIRPAMPVCVQSTDVSHITKDLPL